MKSSSSSIRLLLLISLVAPTCRGQQPLIGTPAFGSYAGGPDIVNLGNLNIHLDIPIRHKAGRGTDFDYSLSYDSSFWNYVWTGSTRTWQPSGMGNWGWNKLTTVGQVYANYNMTYTSGTCGQYNQSYQTWNFQSLTYYDEYGVVHPFNNGGTYINSPGGNGCPAPGAYPSGSLRVQDAYGWVAYSTRDQGQCRSKL